MRSRLAIALASLGLLCGAVGITGASGDILLPDHLVSSTARIVPLDRSGPGPVPVTLRTSFVSSSRTGEVPSLSAISLELIRGVTIDGRGLPRCPKGELLESYEERPCPKSLVGHGSVTSEVTLPGEDPTTMRGPLRAYYGVAEGRPGIFAQVKGEDPPLTYVIPFRIEEIEGKYGTRLAVRKMSRIVGKCAADHPNCLAQPYTLKGIYTQISRFSMSLGRRFARGGETVGLVEAECASLEGASEQQALQSLHLDFADGETIVATAFGRACSHG